jgi:anti-sigma-K factor RskA
MMIEDELLIAYADGECDDADRARVEQALATDPDLRARLEQHRRLAARLSAHYGPVAEAPVPDRLTALLRKQEADVIDFAAARKAKETRRRLPGWGGWGAIAASLAVGLFAGQLALPGRGGVVESRQGALIARGELAEALDVQLASAQPADGKVRIGISFRDQSGQYCRSFQMAALAGIGCRSADGWRLPITHSGHAAATGGGYQQAASGDTLVMEAATAMMRDAPLDAETERKVRDNGWR